MANATIIPIGELLTRAGILTEKTLNEALAVSRQRLLPLGKVLIMQGFIKPNYLIAAVEAQSLINDSILSLEKASEALSLVARDNLKLAQALEHLGWQKERSGSTNRLGELLVEAEVITPEQLDEALKVATATGLPAGRVLVFRNFVANEVVLACLTAQKLIREKLITRAQAVQGLKAVHLRQMGFEESLRNSGFYRLNRRRSTPIGYILVQAGFLDQAQLMTCMEVSLTHEKPIGEILVEHNLLSPSLLQAAIQVQELIDNNTFTAELAARSLKQVFSENCSAVRAIAHACLPVIGEKERALIQEFLTLSGLAEQKELSQLPAPDTISASDFEKQLLEANIVGETILYSLFRAVYLIQNKFLVQEDVIMVLHQCKLSNIHLDDALKELGWTVTTRRRT